MKSPEIDPSLIPCKTLRNGDKIPSIGLGTFGSDHISHLAVAQAVEAAVNLGYRHIDCASVYGNEKEIGKSLNRLINENRIQREDLWITSKLWNDKHGENDVVKSCLQTIRDLQVEYLDLYLIHWPFPNFHPQGCDVTSRSNDAKPYIHENYMRTWRKLEELVQKGYVRNIGTSNMTIPKLQLLLRDAEIKPSANELELHPHFQQPKLFRYLKEQDIQPIGYCPIGSPARPERDRTPDDTSPTEDPVLVEIAENHGIHPATLCVKWAAQRGQIPIPFSTSHRNIAANLRSLTTPPLTEEEMNSIERCDRNCRLIKGQVFLWKERQDWHDLWDEDGFIVE